VDRHRTQGAITQERLDIADLIDHLDEAQLTMPSLCGGWDVKTVAAHLVSDGCEESASLRPTSTTPGETGRKSAGRPSI
jgi:hypothetical protein